VPLSGYPSFWVLIWFPLIGVSSLPKEVTGTEIVVWFFRGGEISNVKGSENLES
jgi:hypothetical protein